MARKLRASIYMNTTTSNVILVTGCSGLLGERIVSDLAGDFTIVGVDISPPSSSTAEKMAFYECDLTDDESVEKAMARVGDEHGSRLAAVIHLAAYYDFSGQPSELYDQLTVEGTRRLLRALQSFEVERLVFSSTLLVMEPGEIGDTLDESSPLQAEWDYPRSKIETEEVLRVERGQIPVTVLRLAGAYDEEGHSPPITQQIARIYEKKLESYFFPGNSDHSQPFVHIEDAVAAVRKAVEHRNDVDDYAVYLIAEPERLSYARLQEALGRLIHGDEWPALPMPASMAKAGAWVKDKLSKQEQFIKPWMVDLADAHYPVTIDKARRELGWAPEHELETVLPAMVRNLEDDPGAFYEENGLS